MWETLSKAYEESMKTASTEATLFEGNKLVVNKLEKLSYT